MIASCPGIEEDGSQMGDGWSGTWPCILTLSGGLWEWANEGSAFNRYCVSLFTTGNPFGGAALEIFSDTHTRLQEIYLNTI